MGSSYTLLQQTQQWLDPNKLTIVSLDPALVETVHDMVFARASASYNVAGWTSQANTPSLIQKVESLLLASWYYAKAYSEVTADTENRYASRLEQMAEDLLSAIEAGMVDLLDADPATFTPANNPNFLPSESFNGSIVYDAGGNQVGYAGSEDIKFRMGSTF
jgi:hypothetical protein